jgi:hypothetical protein
VETLPPDQRDTVRLRFYEGLSTAETADRLGVVPGTVKSRLFRAMSALRIKLEAYETQSGPGPEIADLYVGCPWLFGGSAPGNAGQQG